MKPSITLLSVLFSSLIFSSISSAKVTLHETSVDSDGSEGASETHDILESHKEKIVQKCFKKEAPTAPATSKTKSKQKPKPKVKVRKKKKPSKKSSISAAEETIDADGTITVSITVEADGTVSKADIKESSFRNSSIENCVSSYVKGIKLPKTSTGFETDYPFIFSSHFDL